MVKANPTDLPQEQEQGAAEIQQWIVAHLAKQLDIKPIEVDVALSFERYGLDSLSAMKLVGDLEDWLDCELSMTLLYDYPTIERIAQYLAQEHRHS